MLVCMHGGCEESPPPASSRGCELGAGCARDVDVAAILAAATRTPVFNSLMSSNRAFEGGGGGGHAENGRERAAECGRGGDDGRKG